MTEYRDTRRSESSVRVELDAFGQPTFPGCASGPVIHRTPEELGIPRTVADAEPERLRIWPDWGERGKQRWNGGMGGNYVGRVELGVQQRIVADRAGGMKLGELKAKYRLGLNSVTKILKAAGVTRMKQELKKKEVAQMPLGKYGQKTPPEIAAKIVANEENLAAAELAAKYEVSTSTVGLLRKKAGATGPYKKKRGAAQLIDVDPKRSSGAAALLNALAKSDAKHGVVSPKNGGGIIVNLHLTDAEVCAVLAQMNQEKRAAFFAAGLRAALLA
jgi:hypothetical protein